MPGRQTPTAPLSSRFLAEGEGWRAAEVICRSGPDDRIFEERHDWFVVAAVLGGTFTYRSSQGRALMAPGALLLGSAGTCFECDHEHGGGDRCVAFQFAPQLAEDVAAALGRQVRARFGRAFIPPLPSLLPAIAEARALARAPDPLRTEQLALDLLATAFAADQGLSETAPDARNEKRAASAVGIMAARYPECLTIAGLAREVGLGPRHFTSVFRRVVGVTPYRYILNLRLDAAAQHLVEGGAPVLDIALDVGFGDLSEFTRAFRARFGQPPARYRRARGARP